MAGTTGRRAEASPRTVARLAAGFYLLTIVLGGFGESIHGRLVAPGDAAATAANVLAQPGLLRLGFAAYLVEMACNLAMTAFFYELLRPVNRTVALLAAWFSVVGIAIKTVSRLFYLAPLTVLEGQGHLGAFETGQLQALALLLFRVNAQGAGMALVFFGFYAILKGYLIVRSTFLPRALGVLGMVAGAGWLAFLSPPLGMRFFGPVVALALLASAAQILWLLVFGVNEARWRELAGRAALALVLLAVPAAVQAQAPGTTVGDWSGGNGS